MEFKQKGIERAKEYVKEVNSKELINYILPNCDVTVGDVCFDDYKSGYNQAIQDSKAPEMLEMLKETTEVIKWYMDNFTSELSEPFFNIGANQIEQIEQLIKQATELLNE